MELQVFLGGNFIEFFFFPINHYFLFGDILGSMLIYF